MVINITAQSTVRRPFALDCLFITGACIYGYACILLCGNECFHLKFPQTVSEAGYHVKTVVINALCLAVSVEELEMDDRIFNLTLHIHPGLANLKSTFIQIPIVSLTCITSSQHTPS